MRRFALLAATSLACALAACGDREPPPAPVDAAAELAAAQARDGAGDERGRDEALRRAAEGEGEPARRATTWLASIALQDDDPEGAEARLAAIVARFDGRAVDADGRDVNLAILAEAIAEKAATVARDRVNGPSPDSAAGAAAVTAGRRALERAGEGVEELRAALDAAAAYVAVGNAPVDLSGLVDGAARGTGPVVVVFTDHFELGNAILPSVLKRWSKGLRVACVGIRVGKTRLGIRRVAATPEEEDAALEERVKELGLVWAGAAPEKDGALRRLGIDPHSATVFVLDGGQTLRGRLSARALDPRPLDPIVASLAPAPADDGR